MSHKPDRLVELGQSIQEGPFRAHHVREGSYYELSDGHAIRCAPSGERHGGANLRGGALLASDPAVDSAAEGVLQNPVPALAFFERDAAYEMTLRNLLNRRGFASLESVWEQGKAEGKTEGKAEGRAEALREAISGICEVLAIPLSKRRHAQLQKMDATRLSTLFDHLRRDRRWPARA